jgi:hypothetical protein
MKSPSRSQRASLKYTVLYKEVCHSATEFRLHLSVKQRIILVGGDDMGKKDKLLTRLISKPRDFTFVEARSLLESFGYIMSYSGKTGGSRVCFIRNKKVFRMHKPHPRKELLAYQIKELIDELKQEGLL